MKSAVGACSHKHFFMRDANPYKQAGAERPGDVR